MPKIARRQRAAVEPRAGSAEGAAGGAVDQHAIEGISEPGPQIDDRFQPVARADLDIGDRRRSLYARERIAKGPVIAAMDAADHAVARNHARAAPCISAMQADLRAAPVEILGPREPLGRRSRQIDVVRRHGGAGERQKDKSRG
jgi:hypothetical protein